MSKVDVIRAWKDEEYRQSLTEAQRASVPPHPSGLIELKTEEMGGVLGGSNFECHQSANPNHLCNTFQATCTC